MVDQPRIRKYPVLVTRSSAPEVRVVVWNVCHFSPADDVLSNLKELDGDILILTEVDGNAAVPEMINNLGYGGVFLETAVFSHRGRIVASGCAIFSRFPL